MTFYGRTSASGVSAFKFTVLSPSGDESAADPFVCFQDSNPYSHNSNMDLQFPCIASGSQLLVEMDAEMPALGIREIQIYGSRMSCPPCGVGKYSSAAGSMDCLACDLCTFSSGTGATACSNCPAGRYSKLLGASMCSKCAAGHSKAASSTVCHDCSPGKYSTNSGASTCNSCSAGHFPSYTGASSMASLCGLHLSDIIFHWLECASAGCCHQWEPSNKSLVGLASR